MNRISLSLNTLKNNSLKKKNLFDILLICIISVQNSQINCIYIYRFAAIELVLFNMGKQCNFFHENCFYFCFPVLSLFSTLGIS